MDKLVDLPHSEITSIILDCCFDVMNELGIGFLESVYKKALYIALRQKNVLIGVEQSFEVIFRGKKVGFYKADPVKKNGYMFYFIPDIVSIK